MPPGAAPDPDKEYAALQSALEALESLLDTDSAIYQGVVGMDIGSSRSGAWHSIFQTLENKEGKPRRLTHDSVEWKEPISRTKEDIPTVCTDGTHGEFLIGEAAITSGQPVIELIKLQASIQDKQLTDLRGSELLYRGQNPEVPKNEDKTLGGAFKQLSIACQDRTASDALALLGDFVKEMWDIQIWPHICSELLKLTGKELSPTDMSLVLVITVPVCWMLPEWAAWLKTFRAALDGTSIKSIQMIPETQAAVMGIVNNPGLKPSIAPNKIHMICDLGGGTADTGLYELLSTKPVRLEEIRSFHQNNFRRSGLFGAALALNRLKFLVGRIVDILQPTRQRKQTKARLFRLLEKRFHNLPEEVYSDDEEYGKKKEEESGRRVNKDDKDKKGNDKNNGNDKGKSWEAKRARKAERARLNNSGDFKFQLDSLDNITKAQLIKLETLGFHVQGDHAILPTDLFKAVIREHVQPIVRMLDDGVTGAIELLKWRKRYGSRSRAKKVVVLVVGGFAKNRYVQSEIRYRVGQLVDVVFLPNYKKTTISEGAVWYVLSGMSRQNPAMPPPALKRGWVEDIPFDFPKESDNSEDSDQPEEQPKVPKGTVYCNDRLSDVAFMTETGSGIGHVDTRAKVDSQPCIKANHELMIDLVWSFDGRDKSVVGPTGTHIFGRPNFYAMGDPDNLIRRIATLRIQFQPEWSNMLLRSIIHAHGYSGSAGVFEFRGKLDHDDMTWRYEFVVPLCGHFECAPKPRPVKNRSNKKKEGKQRPIPAAMQKWMAEEEEKAAERARAGEICSKHQEGSAHTLAVKCSGTMDMVELIKFEDLNAGPCQDGAAEIVADNVELIGWPIDTEDKKRKRDASTAAGPSQKTLKVTKV